jgi:hypothetical protein
VTNITDNFFYPYATTDNFIGDFGSGRVVDFPRMVGPKTLFVWPRCLPHQKQAAENNTRQRTLPCHGQLASHIEEL